MKKLAKQIIEMNTEPLWEMSNLRQDETGLSRIIWVSVKSGRERHGPRIKVQHDKVTKVQKNNWVSVSIDDDPRVVEGNADLIKDEITVIKKFILDNKKTLLDYWNGATSTRQMLDSIKQITETPKVIS